MKLYEIVLRPVSGFGTPLKGDTLFGHFCWQTAHDDALLEDGLDTWVERYAKSPFAVFSSAFPVVSDPDRWMLKKPDIPWGMLFPDEMSDCEEFHRALKRFKEKKWMPVDRNARVIRFDAERLTDDRQLVPAEKRTTVNTERSFAKMMLTPHNAINRLTNTTGTGQFAPFAMENLHYHPDMRLVVFVVINEDATDPDRVFHALERMGKVGYGRDASTGMGRFVPEKPVETPVDFKDTDHVYTLAPCVPKPGTFTDAWFTTFVRFGKLGDRLAKSRNPFKNPVIMADEGAVFRTDAKSVCFGRGITDGLVLEKAASGIRVIHQGYAPCLPIILGA